jgi:hypothetical protein
MERALIEQTYWTKQNIKQEYIGKKLVTLFLERNDELKSIYWYGGKYTKQKNELITIDTPARFMKAFTDNKSINGILQYNQFSFSNSDRKKREFIFNISFGSIPNMFSDLSINISHEYFSSKERLKKFIEIGKEIIMIIKPFYGEINDVGDSVRSMNTNQTCDVLNKIPRIFWGNYFGDLYIERIGEDKLLSFKAFKTEKIGDGIYIQLTDSPLDYSKKEFIHARKELENHIGKKLIGYKEFNTKDFLGK